MSVNRFEIMPLLCATAEVLADVPVDDSLTVIIDFRCNRDTASIKAKSLLDSRATRHCQGKTLLRLRMPDDEKSADACSGLVALQPDGFVLSACGSAADIQKIDVMLRVAEAEQGLRDGAIGLLAEVGEKTEFFLSEQPLRNISERLQGLIFDGAALTVSTSSQAHNLAAGRPGAPVLYARAATVLKARQADLLCYELLADEPLSADELRAARDISLADGFSGLIARSADQLAALAAG